MGNTTAQYPTHKNVSTKNNRLKPRLRLNKQISQAVELSGITAGEMVDWGIDTVNKNVTHRMFTHRLRSANIRRDARRYPHPVWPRDLSRAGGAEEQSGRGCGNMRVAPDVLQWSRAQNPECVTKEYREDRQRAEKKPP